MSETIFQEFSVVLEPTDYNSSNKPALILKTHTYKGEPSQDYIAKPFNSIKNIDNINKRIFTPYHISIINIDTNKVLTTTNSENNFIHQSFIDTFCAKYNRCEVVKIIKVEINTSTFEPIFKDNSYVFRFSRTNYQPYEVQSLFKRLLEEVPMDNIMKHKIDIWTKNNL